MNVLNGVATLMTVTVTVTVTVNSGVAGKHGATKIKPVQLRWPKRRTL